MIELFRDLLSLLLDLNGPTRDPSSDLVRIVNNGDYHANYGRLEVWIQGKWSPVYDWAPAAFSDVACKMLGFSSGLSMVRVDNCC